MKLRIIAAVLLLAGACDGEERERLARQIDGLEQELDSLKLRALDLDLRRTQVAELAAQARSKGGFPLTDDDDREIAGRLGTGRLEIDRTLRGMRATYAAKTNPAAGVVMLGASLPAAPLDAVVARFGGEVEATFLAEGPAGCATNADAPSAPARPDRIRELSERSLDELTELVAAHKAEQRELVSVVQEVDELRIAAARFACLEPFIRSTPADRRRWARRVKIAEVALRPQGVLKELDFSDDNAVIVPYDADGRRRLRRDLAAAGFKARPTNDQTRLRVALGK